MQPFAEIADALDQLTFNERVDVLVRSADERGVAAAALEQVAKRSLDCGRVCRAVHTGAHQSVDIRQTARDVVFEETSVACEGGSELERRRIGFAAETAGPEVG